MSARWSTLAKFEVPSLPGTERAVVQRVLAAVGELLVGEARERLKTAVAEATMNAIEHGNLNRADLPVLVRVSRSATAVRVQISDHGLSAPIPEQTHPNIEAKLSGAEKPRGWGLFLIRHMADECVVTNGPDFHTLEILFYLERAGDEHKNTGN